MPLAIGVFYRPAGSLYGFIFGAAPLRLGDQVVGQTRRDSQFDSVKYAPGGIDAGWVLREGNAGIETHRLPSSGCLTTGAKSYSGCFGSQCDGRSRRA